MGSILALCLCPSLSVPFSLNMCVIPLFQCLCVAVCMCLFVGKNLSDGLFISLFVVSV